MLNIKEDGVYMQPLLILQERHTQSGVICYVYTLCEHSYESSTAINSCSNEITAQFF